jgi:hypothetical protein
LVGQVGSGKRVLGTGPGIAVEIKEVYTYRGGRKKGVQYSPVRCGAVEG